MYTPVFVIADEDLLAHRSLFRVMRDYATSERATVVLTGPIEGLGVASRKNRFHKASEVRALAKERMRALGLWKRESA